MGSCYLSALIWLRPETLLFFLMTVLLVQAMTLEIQSTSSLNLEAESVAPQPTVVAPILGKRPKMVSNSTQTEDFQPTSEPVLITGLILAVAAACSAVLAIVVLIVIIFVAIRCYWDRPSKAPPFGSQYPSDGQGYVPVYVDRKMAQSAQMFFYQFQKQQILAQESEQKSKHSADSDSCSEAETKDGHVPMVSCPGLAMKSGEDLEVRNPMFFEDVPTWNGSTANEDDENPNCGTANGAMTSQEEMDVEGTTERESPSAPSPQPPPSTPTSSTPTLSLSDAKTTDVNKNLTQVLREAEVKTRSTSDDS